MCRRPNARPRRRWTPTTTRGRSTSFPTARASSNGRRGRRRPPRRDAQPGPVYDLLIKGGSIVDPVALTTTTSDIGVTGGRIAAVGPSLSERDADRVLNARDLLVAPGLVDLHVHVWWGVAELAI